MKQFFFINHLFFFIPRNRTRSMYFGLGNTDNILMKNLREKMKMNVVLCVCVCAQNSMASDSPGISCAF